MVLWHWNSPFGPLCLAQEGDALAAVNFCAPLIGEEVPCPTPLLAEARRQLEEYFAGSRRVFDLPLAPEGTAFQRAVWEALQAIPYGETRTYGQIAAAVGRPKASRAVGGACHCNPIGIIIPCHRVVGSSGRLTGYAGGLDRKAALLALEQPKP